MNKQVSINKVKEDAYQLFKSGGFYCSEAIVYAIRENFDPSMPDAVVATASGFPVGIGKSKCVCGAVSGGVISLGYFFGRRKPGKATDDDIVHTLDLANELQQSFRDNHRVLCCSVQTKGMDMNSGEHKQQCADFTAEMAYKAAEIIARELKMEVID